MINIGTNTFLHRFVPVQSGDYGVSCQLSVNNTACKFDVLASGKGGISFAFGLESGQIYCSGTSKTYFDAVSSNIASDLFAFQVGYTGFDVYIDTVPVLTSQPKPTGYLEKFYFIGNAANFTGTCNLEAFGNPSNLVISNLTQEFVFPRRQVINTGVAIKNMSQVESRILSASIVAIQSGNIISGMIPVLLRGGEEKFIPISGQYLSTSTQQPLLTTYIYDFANGSFNSLIIPTEYSGLGIRVIQNSIANNLNATGAGSITIDNTGTVSSFISPTISNSGTVIGYSGDVIRSARYIVGSSGASNTLATGDFDTKKFISLQNYPFFFSDRITTSKNDFYLIQTRNYQVPTLVISGASGVSLSLDSNHAGRGLGFFTSKALGHSFQSPYDFIANYLTLPLRGNGDHFYNDSGTQEFWRQVVNFGPEDSLGIYVLSGTGLDTTTALASGWVMCSGGTISNRGFWSHAIENRTSLSLSSYATGFNQVKFNLDHPLPFYSGNTYTILLTGKGPWMTQEVSGQRYITWQGMYHASAGYGNGERISPLQSGNGTGFCVSSAMGNVYFKAMGYQTYQPNFGNVAPIGDDNFGGGITLTGYLRSGVVNLQRFNVAETCIPSSISLNFTSDDTTAQYLSQNHTFQGQGAILNVMICPSLPNGEFPDFTSIICSGSRNHTDFYQNNVLTNVNRPVGWVQERMFSLAKTTLLTGNNNYWLVMSGTNYPSVVDQDHDAGAVPTVRFSHSFVEPDDTYYLNSFSGKKLIYAWTGNVFYSGDPTLPISSLTSSARICTGTWIEHRIFGDGIINSGIRKQFYEVPMTMCFEFGVNSLVSNIWDINAVSGNSNEYLSGNSYQYKKNVTDRLFTITTPLPVLLKAGQRAILNVQYNGLQGYLDYGLLSIPEFNYTGFISGYTQI